MLKVAVVIYATDTSSMQMCGRGVERRVSCVACRVSRRGETSRMNVGELKCNYQAITVEERLGGDESYSFSGALI